MSRDYPSGSLQDHFERYKARQTQDRHLQSIAEHFSQYSLPGISRNHVSVSERPTLPPITTLTSYSDMSLGSQIYHTPASYGESSDDRRLSLGSQLVKGTNTHDHQFPYDNHRLMPTPNSMLPLPDSLEPSPISTSLVQREPLHRFRDLQPPSHQQLTPPYYSAPLSSRNACLGTSSSSDLELSSPSTRVSSRRQLPLHRPQATMPTPATVQPSHIQPTQSRFIDLPHAPPIANGIHLVSPHESLPDKFRAIFPYELFNAVQSKCFSAVYQSNNNMVVSAPTGSGKTVILELAICRLAANRESQNFKVVYQAPTKALCSERARDWEKKFNHMGMQVAELTGDTSQQEMKRVGSASIIVTTPEKWDSVTRKWHDHRRLVELVELFLIDEVHILKDVRGSTLEAVVSRMKTIGASVRFVALSATVPNSEDIAKWLGRDHTNPHLPAHRETFSEDLRPVKLQKHVYGYECNGNEHVFDKFLDSKLPNVLAKHTQRKPILVFCFTRKSCESTAQKLGECWASGAANDKLWSAPSERIPVVSPALQEVIRWGVAFHHAGLDAQDRNAVEQNFLKGQLGVICCTGTLAVGINLPCHTVILKGTSCYQDGNQVREYSDLEVIQMLGRAGRPQFDDSATAIILTKNHNREKYEKMASGNQILESTLHLNLIEHLNSEVVLSTITSLESAKKWLTGTFLSIRLRRNPEHYRITPSVHDAQHVDDKLEEICERDILLLQQNKLATDGEMFRATEYGRAMSTYMVRFDTMKLILQIPVAVKMEQLAAEFRELRIKPNERALFRDVNKSPFILYPVKGTVNEAWHKIFLVVQVKLGAVDLPSHDDHPYGPRQFAMEKTTVMECMQRLVRCFIECKGANCDGVGMRVGLELLRAIAAGSWEGRPCQLLQIPGIGPVSMRKLVSNDVRSVLQLAELSQGDVERLLSRNPPYGKQILDQLIKFPRLTLNTEVISHSIAPPASQHGVVVNVKAVLGYTNQKGQTLWLNKLPYITFMAETTDGTLAYFWRGTMRTLNKDNRHEITFSVNLVGDNDIICHFTCEEVVGTIVSRKVRYTGPRRRVLSHDDGQEDVDLLDDDSDEYPDVDELLQAGDPRDDDSIQVDEDPEVEREPVQLPNGKWQCNHACANGNFTKAGKPCIHRCCREGLDKPRKMKPCKPSSSKRQRQEGEHESSSSRVTPRSTQATSSSSASKRRKRSHTDDVASRVKALTAESATPSQPNKFDDSEIECIDLSMLNDEIDDIQPPSSAWPAYGRGSWKAGDAWELPTIPPTLDKPSGMLNGLHEAGISRQPASTGEDFDTDVFDDLDLASLEQTSRGEFTLDKPKTNRQQAGIISLRGSSTTLKGKERDSSSYKTTRNAIREASKLLDVSASSFSTEDSSNQDMANDEAHHVIVGDPSHACASLETTSPEMADDDFWAQSIFDDESFVDEHKDAPRSTSHPTPDTDIMEDGIEQRSKPPTPGNGDEPAWVQDFDPDIVDMFRGFVNFV